MASFDEDFMFSRMKEIGAYYTDNLVDYVMPTGISDKIPRNLILKYHLMPLRMEDDKLVIVTDNERPFKVTNIITKAVGCPIKLMVTEKDNLKMGLMKHFQITAYQKTSVGAQRISDDISDPDATPLKMKVEQMIQDAAEERASDIHLLPYDNGIYVAFRVNGHMRDYTDRYGFTAGQAGRVVNLVKQKDESGQANINVTNNTDGGSFHISRHGDIFVRFATVPIGATENELQKVNLRLLPQSANHVTLDQIGYVDDDLKAIKSTLYKYPTGLFLNSGPTGAGKTTSLYAQMYYVYNLAGEPLNVMTIDNPIEIREPKFTQMQVHYADAETANLTEKKILKVCLRSDPDMFLYNEIRDEEDARVALEASTTGHRVFSTVHAGNCVKTILRLLGLDVSRILLLSEIRMIISQRLVGKLCPDCSKPHTLTDEEISILTPEEIKELTAPGINLREKGSPEDWEHCKNPKCDHGIIGRTAIAEYIIFNNIIRDSLLNDQGFQTVAKTLKDHGFVSMWQKGLLFAAQGYASLDEIIRIIGKEE